MTRLTNLFLTVLSLSAMGAVVILCVVLLDKLFRINYSRQWIYIIWLVIALRLIIPVNISLITIPEMNHLKGVAMVDSVDIIPIEDSTDRMNGSESMVIRNNTDIKDRQDIENEMDAIGSSKPLERSTATKSLKESVITNNIFFLFPVIDILAVIWIVGVLLFMGYHFGAYFIYRKKISRWSIQITNNEVLEQYHDLCEEMKIKSNIKIVTCNQVQSPMLLGFMKPCIVLPSRDFTAEQYYFIMKHELIHFKRWDLFYKLIMLFATAIHWFNPLVHYMAYLANHDLELYCDERLVAEHDLSYREKYSKMLLQMITAMNKKDNVLLSTGFGNQSSRLKNRFVQIMNLIPTKKGRGLIIILICLIAMIGNFTAWFIPTASSDANVMDQRIDLPTSSTESKDSNNSNLLEEVSNILVVGIDGANNDKHLRADSIVVVNVNPSTKKISIVSLLREMYLQIPGHDMDKLSAVYGLGGTKLLKNTIESNFDIRIDHTFTVNMGAFETIIDSIGGVEIELSENEAKYLNSTNYISNKNYRNVKAGKQILNGNQALGYVRVRKIPTLQGDNGDFGRTARLRSLLSSVIEECSNKGIVELTDVMTQVIPSVTTEMSLSQALIYINTILQGDLETDTLTIPTADSYTEQVVDNKNILDIDLNKNKAVLKQLYQ